jgi:RNA polymerase sigma-70 factor (ECF subfamily)
MASFAQPIDGPFRRRLARSTLTLVAGLARSDDGIDEAALAQRAVAGDGDAFAVLYERYEQRVYNLCYRVLGSRDDAADATQEAFVNVLRRLPKLEGHELAFGSYVFTCARNASYDLIEHRRRTEPSDEIPEGGVGADPGDPEDDPERNVLLEARNEEIRAANLELPERQREVLALRELEELSYDEIAEIMDMNRNSVAQLISRARIGLRDALRGTALASIAASSPECERALPLIALQQDGQLGDRPEDADWLGEHLIGCDTCRLGREAMEEAGVSYRAWLPITAGPLLFRETVAEAAELVDADWSETIARREAGTAGARLLPHRRLDVVLVAMLAVLVLLVGLVGAASDDEPSPTGVPVADEQEVTTTEAEPEPDGPAKRRRKQDDPAPAAVPGDEPADEDTVTTEGAAPPPAEERPDRIRRRDRVERIEEALDEGGLTPGDTTDTAPPTPTETTPTETIPTDTVPEEPETCRDAAGIPIPCTRDPGGSTCTPGTRNCPRGGRLARP